MRSVFKWRVATNIYLYITDANPVDGTAPYGNPFVFDKKEGKAYYGDNTIMTLPTGVDEGKIQAFVSNITSESIYRTMYNTMHTFVDNFEYLTPDRAVEVTKAVQNLTILNDYKPYFNLDNDVCVEEAVTPKCEGYEPVFDFRVHTVDEHGDPQVVPYEFYPERNEHDKTLRYVLDFEVPKGEKGDKGGDGAGCKGDKGDTGPAGPTPFFNATASATEATGETPSAEVIVTPDASTHPRTYNLDFKFEIPSGKDGAPGTPGDDGSPDILKEVSTGVERLPYDNEPYVELYNQEHGTRNEVKTRWNNNDIYDPERGITIHGQYESSFYLKFGIPEGSPGIQGPEGRPSTIRIVDAAVEETLEPGEQAQARAEIVSLESNNEFDIHLFFKIPRGQDGENGRDGEDGDNSIRYNFSQEVIPSDEVDTIVLDWDQKFLPTEDDPTVIEETLQLYYPSSWDTGGVHINLNGSDVDPGDTASFYAPTTYGTPGQILMTQGEGEEPTWADVEGGENIDVEVDSNDNTITINAKIPKTDDQLIYFDSNKASDPEEEYDGLFTQQFMNEEVLVVDNDADYLDCTNDDNIEKDILGGWEQLQLSINTSASSYTAKYTNMPEYGLGTYLPGNPSASGAIGYGMWKTMSSDATGTQIKNKINSFDPNGYVLPNALSNYAIESYIGTDSGNTTGDMIGFALVNDDHATPRYVITSTGDKYYRNTLYDDTNTPDDNNPKRPVRCAWACENKTAGTAKVIYVAAPSSGNESFPTGTVTPYKIENIKTIAGRHPASPEALTNETVSSNHEAVGYIALLTFIVSNSTGMDSPFWSNSKTGTIYAIASIYDIENYKWRNASVQLLNGDSSGIVDASYWKYGHYLVGYNSSLDTNYSHAAIIRTNVSFENGKLNVKFSDVFAFSNIGSATYDKYNDSNLEIDFRAKEYTMKTRTISGSSRTHTESLLTDVNVAPNVSVKDENGNTVTIDSSNFWNLFTGKTKYMYHAYSYQNLYIKCLSYALGDKTVLNVDENQSSTYGYGVYKLNAERTGYEKIVGEDPLDYFTGSRESYNGITKKLWYSNGTNIYQIATNDQSVNVTVTNGTPSAETGTTITYVESLSGNGGDGNVEVSSTRKTFTLPTVTTPGDGKLTIKSDNTSLAEFTANQTANKVIQLLSGIGIDLVPDVSAGTITISAECNHVITGSRQIIQAGSGSAGESINEYNVECQLNGGVVKVTPFYEFGTDRYANSATPNNSAKWVKSTNTTQYIGLFMASSASDKGVMKLTLENTATNKTEIHYIGYIEDTYSSTSTVGDGTFCFITTCGWNFICKGATNKLYCYVEVPNSFVGNIKCQPIVVDHMNTRPGLAFFGANDAGTDITSFGWWNDLNAEKTLNIMNSTTIAAGSGDLPGGNVMVQPVGRYNVDILYDFPYTLTVGSMVSDALINDCILHDLMKKVDSLLS